VKTDKTNCMRAVVIVIFRMRNSVRMLKLFVFTIRKWSGNPITNPNPDSIHSNT
jgi:hypothetical protein